VTATALVPALRDVAAPLIYLFAAVAFVLGLKAAVKFHAAARARAFVAAGLLLAGLGIGLERLGTDNGAGMVGLIGFAAALVAGGGLGLWLGRAVDERASAARLAFVPALAGAAAAVVAAATWSNQGAPASGPGDTALAGAFILGAIAAVLGALLVLRGSARARASAGAAAVALLAGWSIALLGLALGNAILLIAGGVVGTAALALARIVAHSAGTSLLATWSGRGRRADGGGAPGADGYAHVRACGSDEAAMLLAHAARVLVVPGFGMPAAQAQHAAKEIALHLEKRGTAVKVAINPVAGCLPGHMNIALDEANWPHDSLIDLASAQELVATVDAVLVVGANDTVNAAAAADRSSPLYGIDALDLTAARLVLVVKRTLGPGAGGVKNPLFENPNTLMLFGDGKRVLQALATELKSAAH
jgi:NAD(P) transhydrogenase subunit beta